ncbi:MAG: hypothetical protein ACI8TQ_002240 [Planctomycetota bacterium]|jgi:hypothetical protein
MRYLFLTLLVAAVVITFLVETDSSGTALEAESAVPPETPVDDGAIELTSVENDQRNERIEIEATPEAIEKTDVDEGVIRVRVVDEDGLPLAGQTVGRRRPKDEDEWLPESPVVSINYKWKKSREKTDDQGLVEVPGLMAGEWFVAAGKKASPGFRIVRVVLPETKGVFVQIEIGRMPSDRLITGVVEDSLGNPVRAYVVCWWTSPNKSIGRLSGWSNSRTGEFAFLPPATARDGALEATVDDSRLRSASASHVDAGTTEIELIMGPSRFVELEVYGSDGLPIKRYRCDYQYQLAGNWVRPSFPPKVDGNGSMRIGLPTVPFKLSITTGDYRSLELGPINPDEVGSVLSIELERKFRITGRVTRKGEPVEMAGVALWPIGPAQWASGGAKTTHDGRFEVSYEGEGRIELRAWKDEVGGGNFGPFDYDGSGLSEIEIEITDAPATLRGQVVLPGDIPVHGVTLSTTNKGFKDLFRDGSYELPNLRPGPRTISVRPQYFGGVMQDLNVGYYSVSHGPVAAPDWLTSESVFELDLQPGEVRIFDIDLARFPVCQLNGQFGLGGLLSKRDYGYQFGDSNFAALSKANSVVPMSRSPLGAEGLFELGCREPGVYSLSIDARLAEGCDIVLSDTVELFEGESNWIFTPEFGALRFLPAVVLDDPIPVPSIELHWQDGEGRKATISYGEENKRTGERVFARLPVGRVRITNGRTDMILGEIDVIADREVEFQMP